MDKIRISQIAKELSKTSKEVLQKAQELGFEVKTASSAVTATQADELYNYILSGANPNATKIKLESEETQSGNKTRTNKKTEKEGKETKKLKVIFKEVGKDPVVMEIDDTLEAKQKLVSLNNLLLVI